MSEVFYYLFLDNIFSGLINGFLLRTRKLYVYIDYYFLHIFFFFLKNSSVLSITSLFDVVAVDYPLRLNNRFEVTYCLLSHDLNFRFFFKVFQSLVSTIPTVSNFFSSAG